MIFDDCDNRWLEMIKEVNTGMKQKSFDSQKKYDSNGNNKKYDKEYCEKMMNYCREKYNKCSGKDADDCRQHYKDKYMKFKKMYEMNKGKKKDGYGKDCYGKDGYGCDKKKNHDCYHTYKCIYKLLEHICQNSKKNY